MTAIVICALWALAIILVLCLFAGAAEAPENPCTNDCEQGRRCTCRTSNA